MAVLLAPIGLSQMHGRSIAVTDTTGLVRACADVIAASLWASCSIVLAHPIPPIAPHGTEKVPSTSHSNEGESGQASGRTATKTATYKGVRYRVARSQFCQVRHVRGAKCCKCGICIHHSPAHKTADRADHSSVNASTSTAQLMALDLPAQLQNSIAAFGWCKL
jgi:hypothetical protein